MDFDDLLLNFVLLLHTNSAVRESLQTKWKHILVDEYQDTNELQGDFIKLLYNAEDASQSLVVVGDDAQSIYSFRGATVENILRFPKQYPGARIYRLEINYRSTTPILNLANHIIAHNNRQYEKSLRGTIEKGEKPVLVIAPTGTHEGEFIAEKVLELRDEGTPMKRVAVLFRAAYHSEALEFELAKRDIPYEYRGGVRFFERAHIKDLLAFLRVFANAKDEVSWLRILNLQAGIGAVGASKIFSIVGRENTIEEALGASVSQLGSRLGSGWQNMTRVLRELSRGKDSAPAKVIDIVLKNFYAEYLEAEYPDWRERLDDLEQLKVFASTYEDLTQFVGDLSLYENFSVRKDGEAARDEEKIVLSTIHQAKGLEWDVVFIINLANSAFPNRRALLEDQGIEEERRLLYVAVTRARKQLFLSYPLLGEGEAAFLNQPSMFLDEIPQNLFKIIQMQKIDESHDNAEDPFSDSDVPSIDIGKKFSGYLGNY